MEEGLVAFSKNKDAALKFQRDEVPTPDPGHRRFWLKLEANQHAVAAGFAKPHPHEPDLGEDNLERFFYDYYLAQREREKTCTYIDGMARCPCVSCARRRETCSCKSCTSSRRSPGSSTGALGAWLESEDNRAVAAERLGAAAAEERRRNPRDSKNHLARQLEQLKRFVLGGYVEDVIT
jgi:hypothetical protein